MTDFKSLLARLAGLVKCGAANSEPQPPPGRERFELRFEMFGQLVDTAIVEVDDGVLDIEERGYCLGPDVTEEDIMVYLGQCCILHGIPLHSVEGLWGDLPDSSFKVVKWPILVERLEIKVKRL